MSNNDESFQLSVGAQNVEARFYNKTGIVYVEGDDDIIFWSQYFNPSIFEIRKVSGCKNLADYEDDILHHGLKCIVAKDADYSSYMANANSHPLIVCTLSHSIECVMYCPYNINAFIQKLSRNLDNHVPEIISVYDKFCNDIEEMLVYDIANNIYGIGCSVCGDSCKRILRSNTSLSVSKDKIDNLIRIIQPKFTKSQIKHARRLLKSDKRHYRQICKGHFQTGFVLNLLRYLTSKIRNAQEPSISKDALFAQLVKCFPECREKCEERMIINQRVSTAIATL